jgi:riboflavin synthase
VDVSPEGGSVRIGVSIPSELAPLVAAKGAIALDGVSLTVNDVSEEASATRFTVNVIPHTGEHTTLGDIGIGRQLNVEADVLARYIDRMMTDRSQ